MSSTTALATRTTPLVGGPIQLDLGGVEGLGGGLQIALREVVARCGEQGARIIGGEEPDRLERAPRRAARAWSSR